MDRTRSLRKRLNGGRLRSVPWRQLPRNSGVVQILRL